MGILRHSGLRDQRKMPTIPGMPEAQERHIAYVAVGSNLGDRRGTIEQALAALERIADVRIEKISRIRQTAPVGGPAGQGDYLNLVLEIRTGLAALPLLDVLQSIETMFGRVRTERWGPRSLDLDLLLYDDAVIRTERLIVPHPRMHERRFVLEPLCDIAPGVVHPSLGLKASELLERLP